MSVQYEPGTEGLTDPNHHLKAALEAVAATARALKEERDAARADATALAERLTALELSSTAELERLERELDEARRASRKFLKEVLLVMDSQDWKSFMESGETARMLLEGWE